MKDLNPHTGQPWKEWPFLPTQPWMTRMPPIVRYLARLRVFRRRGDYWRGALSMAAARVSFVRRMGRPPRWARDEVTGRMVNELFDEALWLALTWEKHRFPVRVRRPKRPIVPSEPKHWSPSYYHRAFRRLAVRQVRQRALMGYPQRRALWLNASLRAELEARFGRPCTDEELAIAILHGHRPAFMVRRA